MGGVVKGKALFTLGVSCNIIWQGQTYCGGIDRDSASFGGWVWFLSVIQLRLAKTFSAIGEAEPTLRVIAAFQTVAEEVRPPLW